jgi:hypothetical protein
MEKVYAALVIAAALATCLELVLGFTAAIATPSVFFCSIRERVWSVYGECTHINCILLSSVNGVASIAWVYRKS